MKYRLFVGVVVCWLILLAGCATEREFRPGTDYPEWAFDRPTYQRPAKEPVPFIEGREGLPDIYYNKQSIVFIKRPERPDPRKAPRPAVFSTKDNGQSWKKEGHFGIGVPYFVFQVPEDGTYGICIIGAHRPDLAPANLQIQHVQVVDSTDPQVEVSISPEEAPYWVGQRIWLSWKITDAHLVKAPGKLYSKVVDSDKPTPWELLKTGMANSGTARVVIEQMPQRAEGVLFRIEATDKMGNIGVGYSKRLEVLPSVPGTEVKEPSSTTFVIPGGEEQPRSAEPAIIGPDPGERGVEPDTETAPKTEPENVPPLSRRFAAPAEPTVGPTAMEVLSEGQARAPAVPARSEVQPRAENQTDAEMVELEKLLTGISGPVFQGKVHRGPEAKAAPSEPTIVIAPTPLPKVAPPVEPAVKIVKIERVEKESVEAPGERIVIRPVKEQPDEAIIKIGPVEEEAGEGVVAKEAAEGVELLVPPLIEESAAGPTEPIVTVRPPAETEPVPEPEPVVEIVPPAEAAGPVVEPTPIVSAAPAPPATTAGPSGGKERMAKPWERLGDQAAAARDFYKYAPSLSNY